MKTRFLALAGALLLLTACSAKQNTGAVSQTQKPAAAVSSVKLTEEEAKSIALTHAGFTADQVTGLRVQYEIDDGLPVYEVDFRVERLEYDYTIHGETGEILEFEIDD